ncbi:hypothetical protein ARMGADRAFT_1083034 [Armillaria gallica]|uniref:Uncharacterized protein n=1 Tax=Armillaria gallica TaxID=47427 RepID=A0A2H3DRT5_ARMGA|nr:hypothetical protein ARMGADRAFT_1083034 [Armillaria gallica]
MPVTPPAADALSYLDAFIRSLLKPVFPPDEVYPLVMDILRAAQPLLDTDHDWIRPSIALLKGQLPIGDTEDVLDTEQVETLRDLGVELKVVDIGTFAGIGFGNFT